MATIHTIITDSQNNIIAERVTNPTDEILTLAINYFAAAKGYKPLLEDGETPNPETKAEFMLRSMKTYIEEVVTSFAAEAAANTARSNVLANKITL